MAERPEGLGFIPRKKEVPQNEVLENKIPFRPIPEEIFRLAALGFYPEQTAKRMGKKLRTVRYHIEKILKSFGVNSMLKAVIRGAETGNIDIRRVTNGLNIKNIKKLSGDEEHLLDVMTRNGGEKSSYEVLAEALEIPDNLLGSRLKTIYRKLEIKKGRKKIIRVALLYLAWKRENNPSFFTR